MIKKPTHFIDQKGMVIHHDFDESKGGDSLQRTGMMILFADMDIEKKRDWTVGVWGLVNTGPEPVRHWDSRYWPGKPGTMSRDNLTPIFCCFLVLGLKNSVSNLMWRIAARGGFLWNTKHIGQHTDDWKVPDWIGLMLPLLVLRASRFGWGLSYLSDIYLAILVAIRMFKAKQDWDDVGDDLNLTVVAETCRVIKPSFFTTKILSWYHHKRPEAGPATRRPGPGLYQAFQWYFAPDIAPPLDELVIDHLKRNWP